MSLPHPVQRSRKFMLLLGTLTPKPQNPKKVKKVIIIVLAYSQYPQNHRRRPCTLCAFILFGSYATWRYLMDPLMTLGVLTGISWILPCSSIQKLADSWVPCQVKSGKLLLMTNLIKQEYNIIGIPDLSKTPYILI